MIWFIMLVLFLCVICAVQKRRTVDYLPKNRSESVNTLIPPVRLQKMQPVSLPEKAEDRKWLFELGF